MRKLTLITLTLLLPIGGFALYFLSSPDRQVTETFSTFGFKNDPTERPSVGSEEEGAYGVSGDLSEIDEPEEGGWFTRWRNSREDSTDEPEASGGGGSDAGSESGETPSGTLAQSGSTGTETTATGNTGSDTGTTNTGTTATTPAPPPTYTLSIVSPTAGQILSNKSGSPIATIFWTYGDRTAKITVELHNQTGLVRTLTTKAPNSGRLTWDYSATLQDGDYKLVVYAYSSSGTFVTSAETGYFEVSKTKSAEVGSVTIATACPPVPKKVRTYTLDDIPSQAGPGMESSVTLKHYLHPATVSIGKGGMSFGEKHEGATGQNAFSYLRKFSDSGLTVLSEEKFPIIGPSQSNRAFDISLPFIFDEGAVGTLYDMVHLVNYYGTYPAQYSISECEGDFSKRAVLLTPNPGVGYLRATVVITDNFEGSMRALVDARDVVALKAGKKYYLNRITLKDYCGLDGHSNTECYRYDTPIDDIPDEAMFDLALARQFFKSPTDTYLEFYRWNVSIDNNTEKWYQDHYGKSVLEKLKADPMMHVPGVPYKEGKQGQYDGYFPAFPVGGNYEYIN